VGTFVYGCVCGVGVGMGVGVGRRSLMSASSHIMRYAEVMSLLGGVIFPGLPALGVISLH
jgi:hypothetical protein